jgi:UDP-N-acetylmuramate dehydrogenase
MLSYNRLKMQGLEETLARLASIPNLAVRREAPLSRYTRFGIGGPAAALVEASGEEAFLAALDEARSSGLEWAVIGAGTNLIVADTGFRGIVLRYLGKRIEGHGRCVAAQAGAELQSLIDFTIDAGLRGLETMAGIPGSVGGAVYGNAGAYGRSVSDSLVRVRFFDGLTVRRLDNAGCEFQYRESVFKRRKDWVILEAEFALEPAEAAELRRTASEILAVRSRKYPPEMRCAGSIFKNLFFERLPPAVAAQVPPEIVREGKVPAAWFLEQAGAKGLRRGDIRVADYHANLVYNAGAGTAAELCALIEELKRRVRERFGIELEEEVQYLGFEPPALG